ncbi:MAG: amidohydrolase family protein, partial [Clostridiales bacterium]|nr:amidohydrolase family protein [Clostridiales bacterium]
MRGNENIFQELWETVDGLPVVDTHEHLTPESMRVETTGDFFSIALAQYAGSDLISAGMTPKQLETLLGHEVAFEDKLNIFMPFWEKVSNTAYSRVLAVAARGLYDIDEISRESLPELNKRVAEKNKPGLYKEILQDKCRIKYCLWDQSFTGYPKKDDFFRLSLRLDDIVFVNSAEDIKSLEHKYNVSISSPEGLEEIMEVRISNNKPRGLTAIKTALAYNRTLHFETVSRAEAVLSMDHILRNRFTEADVKILQDYMMNSLMLKAFWHNLTIQVHTGLQEGSGNVIYHANPALLSTLVSNHPATRVDLFHGGYPYGGELSAMAKMFPNVYIDMAWLHVISPSFVRRYLPEWLDTVPVSKLMGFGGDYTFVEGVYGHLQLAKENITCVLADKVADGVFTMTDAKRYAKMMLYENPDSLFM